MAILRFLTFKYELSSPKSSIFSDFRTIKFGRGMVLPNHPGPSLLRSLVVPVPFDLPADPPG